MRDFLKNYATPLVVAGFFAIAGTGLMMFFGLAREPVHELHQWIGVTFVIFAALHIAWNWRSLTMRLRQSRAVSVIVVLTVLTAGLVGYKQAEGAREGNRIGPRAVLGTLSHASLATLAPALGLTADEAVTKLKAKGIAVGDTNQSLDQIAHASNKPVPALFAALLGGKHED